MSAATRNLSMIALAAFLSTLGTSTASDEVIKIRWPEQAMREVAWEPGLGFDSRTDKMRNACVTATAKSVPLIVIPAGQGEFQYDVALNEESISEKTNVDFNASVRLGLLGAASTGASYYNSFNSFAKRVHGVVYNSYETNNQEYEYHLKPQYAALFNDVSKRAEFRRKCGTHFIKIPKLAVSFSAVMSSAYTSDEERSALTAYFNGSYAAAAEASLRVQREKAYKRVSKSFKMRQLTSGPLDRALPTGLKGSNPEEVEWTRVIDYASKLGARSAAALDDCRKKKSIALGIAPTSIPREQEFECAKAVFNWGRIEAHPYTELDEASGENDELTALRDERGWTEFAVRVGGYVADLREVEIEISAGQSLTRLWNDSYNSMADLPRLRAEIKESEANLKQAADIIAGCRNAKTADPAECSVSPPDCKTYAPCRSGSVQFATWVELPPNGERIVINDLRSGEGIVFKVIGDVYAFGNGIGAGHYPAQGAFQFRMYDNAPPGGKHKCGEPSFKVSGATGVHGIDGYIVAEIAQEYRGITVFDFDNQDALPHLGWLRGLTVNTDKISVAGQPIGPLLTCK